MNCTDCGRLNKMKIVRAPNAPTLYKYGCGDGYCVGWIEDDSELVYMSCPRWCKKPQYANASIFDGEETKE